MTTFIENKTMKISIINKSHHPLPSYETLHAAGMDIRAFINDPVSLKPLERTIVPTGLFIVPALKRKSDQGQDCCKKGVTVLNSPGTIDADYRGEIKVILVNLSNEEFIINDGERIAQLVIARHEKAEWAPTESLQESERGAGGFGSTGTK
jgi:dUTP pyrophosphatase